jgi:hypothetical protein
VFSPALSISPCGLKQLLSSSTWPDCHSNVRQNVSSKDGNKKNEGSEDLQAQFIYKIKNNIIQKQLPHNL